MISGQADTARPHTLGELSGFRVMEWLFWLRNLMILVQFFAILIAVSYMEIPLPLWPIGLAPLALLVFNVLVYWRLERGESVTELEITLHLVADMLVFSWLLYWTGGSVNPFVSAYLVPVAAAAAFVPPRYAVTLGLLSVGMYSFMMIWYVPLPPMNGRFGGDFSLHIFGMWLSFLFSAAITIAFVSSLARLVRQREVALKKAEQESINSQHLVALGSLAAGAAHELSTPLSSISMLSDELADAGIDETEKAELVAALKGQLELCQSQIAILRDQAHQAQNPEIQTGDAGEFVHGVLERFKAMRSEMEIRVQQHALPGRLQFDPALSQALLNLLNNAADASAENGRDLIEVDYGMRNNRLIIDIDDFGRGLSAGQQAQVGAVPFSTKHEGMGIGLLLSHANVSRLGGELTLRNREDGQGARTEIMLPCSYPESDERET